MVISSNMDKSLFYLF